MRRLWIVPIVFVMLLAPAVVLAGVEDGFDVVVRSIESRYHVHAEHAPFMDIASAITQGAEHGGLGGMRVANFNNFPEPVNGAELKRLVAEKLGAGWEEMIHEISREDNGQTLIYVHTKGERSCMLIVNLEKNELNVVELSIDSRDLKESIGRYEHQQNKGKDQGEESD